MNVGQYLQLSYILGREGSDYQRDRINSYIDKYNINEENCVFADFEKYCDKIRDFIDVEIVLNELNLDKYKEVLGL